MKRFLIYGLFLFMLVVFIPLKTEARPFIGSDCYTVTTGGGESCFVTKTICRRYFFWIHYDSEITDVQIDCSHLRN